MSRASRAASFFPSRRCDGELRHQLFSLSFLDSGTVPGTPSAGTFAEAAAASGAALSSIMFKITQSRCTYQKRDVAKRAPKLLFEGEELCVKEVLHALVCEGRRYVSSSLNYLPLMRHSCFKRATKTRR